MELLTGMTVLRSFLLMTLMRSIRWFISSGGTKAWEPTATDSLFQTCPVVFLSDPLTMFMKGTSTLPVPTWPCDDCKVNVNEIDEYYMVEDEIWLSVMPDFTGMLCIGCLENRLGRVLTPPDFPLYPINMGYFRQSDRLRSRIKGE